MEEQKSNLNGHWFHSFDKSGIKIYQGQVLKQVGNYYLVQLYSWIDGRPTYQKLFLLSHMKEWHFYPTNKKMLEENKA